MNPSVLALLLLTASLAAQAPSGPWRTFHTGRYRIHHPDDPAFAAFAREVAGRIEGFHAAVGKAVGHAAPGPIDVLVRDPIGEANGMAYPLLGRPYVELWRTPPEANSPLAHNRGWEELLVVHELVHIHHLTWPQERANLMDRLLYRLTGPVLRKSPRWVTEGYATLLEGRLTGRGRPHGAYRAAVIRQWALEGKLPTYEAVSGGGGFLGGSMAYLLGSAHLEWLERRNPEDPEILQKLWRRLADGRHRDFDTCFRATFGLGPRDAYDRWRAEVTHDALLLERRLKAENLLREGQGFARLQGMATDLAVSPDGTKLLARVLDPQRPGLRVWDLTKPEEAPKPKAGELPDRAPEFLSATPRWTKARRDGRLPRRAWWTGPATITYELRLPDAQGMLRPTYRTWDLATGQDRPGGAPPKAEASPIQRQEVEGIWNLVKVGPEGSVVPLTRVRSAAWLPAPTPDGKAVYFVLLRAQGCDLRRLDLGEPPLEARALPATEPLVPGAVQRPEDGPSVLEPAVPVAPSAPYRLRDTHRAALRSGAVAGPAASSFEVGVGGADLLGRLHWFALGAFGDARGPRGAGIGLAYRGWALEPSLQAFHMLERPSRQEFAPVPGLDRVRQGAEAAVTYVNRGEEPFRLRLSLAHERVRPWKGAGPEADRTFAGAFMGFQHTFSRGERWGLTLAARIAGGGGWTEGAFWRLSRTGITIQIHNPIQRLTLKAQEGRLEGRPGLLDRFQLGGMAGSLEPESLGWTRLEQPALPAFVQTGTRLRSLRGELGHEVRGYFEHAEVWDPGALRLGAVRMAGVEVDLTPLLAQDAIRRILGPTRLVFGLHRPLDGVMKDRTVATVQWNLVL